VTAAPTARRDRAARGRRPAHRGLAALALGGALAAAGCATVPAPAAAPPAPPAAPPVTAPPLTVTLWEWGEYAPVPVRTQVAAPGTTTGHVHLVDPVATPELLRRTTEVRASVGVRFGIRFIVNGPEFGTVVPLRIRVLHPPMRHPAGRVTEREEWPMEANARLPRYTGWRFEERWELVPGPWVIQVLDPAGDAVLAQQAFTVTP
jgi:hypothetical protein